MCKILYNDQNIKCTVFIITTWTNLETAQHQLQLEGILCLREIYITEKYTYLLRLFCLKIFFKCFKYNTIELTRKIIVTEVIKNISLRRRNVCLCNDSITTTELFIANGRSRCKNSMKGIISASLLNVASTCRVKKV